MRQRLLGKEVDERHRLAEWLGERIGDEVANLAGDNYAYLLVGLGVRDKRTRVHTLLLGDLRAERTGRRVSVGDEHPVAKLDQAALIPSLLLDAPQERIALGVVHRALHPDRRGSQRNGV